MVMGRDSCSNGRGFESRHRILDGPFSHLFVVKKINVCLKRPKINEKRPGLAHFFLKKNEINQKEAMVVPFKEQTKGLK